MQPAIVTAVVASLLDDDDNIDKLVENMHCVKPPILNPFGTDIDTEIAGHLGRTGGHLMFFARKMTPASIRDLLLDLLAEVGGEARRISRVDMTECFPVAPGCPVLTVECASNKLYTAATKQTPPIVIEFVTMCYEYAVIRIASAWGQWAVNALYARLLEAHNRIVMNHRHGTIDYVKMMSGPICHPASIYPVFGEGGITCPLYSPVVITPGLAAEVFGKQGRGIKRKIDRIRHKMNPGDAKWCQQPMVVPMVGVLDGSMMVTLDHTRLCRMSEKGSRILISGVYSYVMGLVRRRVRERGTVA